MRLHVYLTCTTFVFLTLNIYLYVHVRRWLGRSGAGAQVKGVYKEGGAGAFYKGALPRALKSALNIAVQFFLYDSLKRLANVSPDDLKVRAMRCGGTQNDTNTLLSFDIDLYEYDCTYIQCQYSDGKSEFLETIGNLAVQSRDGR